MTALADLNASKRRENIRLTVDAILRRQAEPIPTATLVGLVADALGEAHAKNLIARALVDLATQHPAASQTGETFERFGRTMRRWAWAPLARKRRESTTETEARRERQRAAEAEDEWTIRPADGEFLEDDDA